MKNICMSSSKSSLVAGESVNLTCTATLGLRMVYSMCGVDQQSMTMGAIISSHSMTYIYLRLESIFVLLVYIIHASLLVFLVFPLFFNVFIVLQRK